MSTRWPAVAATIVTSEVILDTDGGTSYEARVAYRYGFGGQEHKGKRIRFGDVFSLNFPSVAHASERKYRAGTTVPVRVNPTNPRVSVLEPGINIFCIASILVSLFFLWVAISALRAR